MAETGLLFIPDISGFTRFINQTEIDHSRYIIQELLEALINSNQLQLQVSEVEGDAILFYRFGNIPKLSEIYEQVRAMFCNFHRILRDNSLRRICQCAACRQADSLTLKIITHKGSFSTYTVKEYSKLIGKDVITAHQLLKNEIPLHEYWLVSDTFFNGNPDDQTPQGLKWEKGMKETESGDIAFRYSLLTHLKQQIPEAVREKLGIKGPRIEMFSMQREYDVDIHRLFSVLGDISQRPNWMVGLKGTTDISTRVNQLGTTHNCLLEKGIEVMTTSDFQSDDYRIMMEETDKKKMGSFQFELIKQTEHSTLLNVRFFMKKFLPLNLVFRLFMEKKFRKQMEESLIKLGEFLKTNTALSCHC